MSNSSMNGTALVTGASTGIGAVYATVSQSVATTSSWWPETRRG